MAEQQSGFRLAGTFYPWPQSFRLGDPVLIREVTGMSWPEFVDAMDGAGMDDPSVLNGMIAAAIWQANPKWKRERVRQTVEAIGFDEIDIESDDTAGDPGPPPESGSVSNGSPAPQSPAPDESSATTPGSSGQPSSLTTSVGAPPIT